MPPFEPILEQEGGKLMGRVKLITAREPGGQKVVEGEKKNGR